MTAAAAIAARGLCKSFAVYARPRDLLVEVFTGRARHASFEALRDVTFEVGRGEVVGIMGRNGAGKSTLLKLVAGTLEPTRGSVRVEGRVAAILELGTGFHPQYTGRENVLLGGMCLGMGEREVRGKLDEIIEFSELRDFIDQPLRTYSTGMYTRLAFATAVAVDPGILIIDEALSVGDAKFQLKCFDRFRAFRREGRTILLVSHSSEQIALICDRAILLERGAVIEDGPANQVTRTYHRLLFGGGEAADADPAPGPSADRPEVRDGAAPPPVRPPSAPPVAIATVAVSPVAVAPVATSAAAAAVESPSPSSDVVPPDDLAAGPAPPATPEAPIAPTRAASTRAVAPPPPLANLDAGTRMGTGDVRIERLEVLDDAGRDVRRLEPGARYRFRFEAVARRDAAGLSAGFLVRDRSGQTIYGLDTRLEQDRTFSVDAGERFAVSMTFVNHLGPGEHFLGFGVAYRDGTKLDYCYDAVEFVAARRAGVYHASRADLEGALEVERDLPAAPFPAPDS